jgi:hypothetical protein
MGFKTTSFWASKRRHFDRFTIKIILLKKSKRKILKKKKRMKEIRVAPLAKNGVVRPPIFGQGWLEPPPRPIWGWSNHPHDHPQKAIFFFFLAF